MNIKKSVEIALATQQKKKAWLAGEMGISRASLGERLKTNNPTSTNIEQMAVALGMKSSALIALGE